MAKNFAEIAFSDTVKALQEKHGSRVSYERMERQTIQNSLTDFEIDFIQKRDSFYMSTIGENGFPYIQHRGGFKGFLKVIDEHHIGFIDYSGNKQYISVGNLTVNNKVSIILVDYPSKARLKIYATAKIVELSENPDLFKSLNSDLYQFKPERMMVLNLEAFDWNCPQHITQRYTIDEIEHALAPQKAYIKQLENEIILLKNSKKTNQ